MAIMQLVDKNTAVEKDETTIEILLDLSKAFDRSQYTINWNTMVFEVLYLSDLRTI